MSNYFVRDSDLDEKEIYSGTFYLAPHTAAGAGPAVDLTVDRDIFFVGKSGVDLFDGGVVAGPATIENVVCPLLLLRLRLGNRGLSLIVLRPLVDSNSKCTTV